MKTALLVVLSVVALLLLVVVFNLFQPGTPPRQVPALAYSDLIAAVDAGQVRAVTISDTMLTGEYADGHAFETALPTDPTLVPRLLGKGVHVSARAPETPGGLLRYALNWLPSALFLGLWFWFLRRVTGSMASLARTVEALPAALAARER